VRSRGGRAVAGGLAWAALAAVPAVGAAPRKAARPSLVLITLDTTRADHVGQRPDRPSLTPNLDALARQGTRYARALTASPLTLPAHCSLLTGLQPPAHGVRDNGVVALPAGAPTLATVLSAEGYQTGAFVASRVLDRRFGLDRGFDVYDDRMVAEQTGEQGYPERDAAAVTAAALAWTARLSPSRPYLLWVHYYDPHAPYQPPGGAPGLAPGDRYAGEVAYMDREVGRLLAGLPGPAARRLVAAVGDHGEMLGEHGERDHGIFLYRGSLEVPLLVAGPGVAPGRVVTETVATRGLAAGLLALLGLGGRAGGFGEPLPGLRGGASRPMSVYSETFLPATAYGWSPLKALTEARWKYIGAPRPELYDLGADAAESRNLVSERPEEAARLREAIAAVDRPAPAAPPVALDPAHAEALRSLGYHAGPAAARGSGLDPKDGIALLREFEEAKEWMRQGRHREAEARLDDLVRRSPGNVPFLSRLAEAQAASGRREAAVATWKHAASLNPGLDFLHLALAEALAGLGRSPEARAEYDLALKLNPRMAKAWMGLAEIVMRSGPPGEELRVLRQGEAAGTESGAILSRLAQLEIAAGDLAAAEAHAARATRLVPEFGPAWWLWGEVAEKRGQVREAVARYEKAVALGVADPRALARLDQARRLLQTTR
jgi:choline-sulfatase